MAVGRPARAARGQHFLRSSRLAAQLVRAAGVASGDVVVDVGAGTGILTRPLAATGAEVVALELDPGLVTPLRRRFAGSPNVTVLERDVREWQWPQRPFVVVSNIPFGHSGEIAAALLGRPERPLQRALLVVQWEFACRYAAVWPSTLRAAYSHAWFDVSIAGRLAAAAFSPPPRASAAVLVATRRASPLVDSRDAHAYHRFLEDAFRAGVPLRRHLPPLTVKRAAAELGFDPGSRPRDLDTGQLAALFGRLCGKR